MVIRPSLVASLIAPLVALRLVLRALPSGLPSGAPALLAFLALGCRPDPSSSHRIVVEPTGGFAPENVWPVEHRAELRRDLDQGYARWMTCTPRLKPNGERKFTWERRWPDPGADKSQGTVQGTRGMLPLSYWLWLSPEARYSWVAHEVGHTFGILDLDTGRDPSIMSYTASAPDVTARDCLELCRIWAC